MRILKSASALIAVVVAGAIASHSSEGATQGASPSAPPRQGAPALDVDQRSALVAHEVGDSIGRERDLSEIEVSVEGSVVTLRGQHVG
jgi:hypothetical protein